MKLIRTIMIVIFVSCSKSEKPLQLIAKVDDKPIYLNDFIRKVSTMHWDMLYLGGNVAKVKFSKDLTTNFKLIGFMKWQ